MKNNSLSRVIMGICTVACVFMLANIVIKYVIPIINGTIAELPDGKVYTVSDVPDEVRDFVNPGEDGYAYGQLNGNEKEAYDRLLMGLCSFADRIDIKACDLELDDLKKVYSCVRNDYPQLFWVFNNCEVYSSGEKITDCLPKYLYDKKSSVKMLENLEEVRDAIIEPVKNASDYEKVMYVFNYIIDNTEYDIHSYSDYQDDEVSENLELSCNIYGTLIGKKALCEGYSKTLQFLLESMDIECLYITGQSKGEGHAWNYVKLDGVYYGMDITWCDPKSDGEIKSYAYCLTDFNTLAVNHEADVPYELPDCTGGVYNYYRYNGYELGVFRTDLVDKMFLKAYSDGQEFIEIRCINKTVYDQFMSAIESQEIFKCFKGIENKYGKYFDTISYGVIEEVYAVRINF